MEKFKIKLIVILLIILNIFLAANCYKFYTSNKIKTTYIENLLNNKIDGLKASIESSIYYIDEFSKNKYGHFWDVGELGGIVRNIDSTLEYLSNISFFFELRYDGADLKQSYNDILWKAYSGYLTSPQGGIPTKDKLFYFNEEQMEYLQELKTLLKDYKNNISNVSESTTLYSDDWVEFVEYFMAR